MCSPIRNPMPRRLRFLVAVMAYGIAGPIGHLVARSAKVAELPVELDLIKGPWFDNNLATLEVRGRSLRLWWAAGVVEDGHNERPLLTRVASVDIEPRPAGRPRQSAPPARRAPATAPAVGDGRAARRSPVGRLRLPIRRYLWTRRVDG